MSSFVVREASADDVIDLRHAVLLPECEVGMVMFSGDSAMSTFHFAAYIEKFGVPMGRPVGCASFMLENWFGEPAWRLRGMAVKESHRGQGLGKLILERAESRLMSSSSIRLLWCDAMESAVSFYEKVGWRPRGAPFEHAVAGPHIKMVKLLKSAGAA